MQSRKRSLIESFTNITIGFGVAFISQRIIYPLFDIHISMLSNFWIVVLFTFISMIRCYIIRRIFTRKD